MRTKTVVFLLISVFAFSSLIQAQRSSKTQSEQTFSASEKFLSVFTGLVAGVLAGGFLGAVIGNSPAYMGEYVDAARGGIIGASIVPVLFYEDWAKKNGRRFPQNAWQVQLGGNITFTNHGGTRIRPGFAFGGGRNYFIDNSTFFRLEALINRRRFFMPNQRIRYASPSTNEIHINDVRFLVTYVDVAYLLGVQAYSFGDTEINAVFGPALSVQMRENTSYDFKMIEEVGEGQATKEFSFIGDEPGATVPFLSLAGALEYSTGKQIIRARFNYALRGSKQIFPLRNHTKLHTLNLLFGYKF